MTNFKSWKDFTYHFNNDLKWIDPAANNNLNLLKKVDLLYYLIDNYPVINEMSCWASDIIPDDIA